VLKIRKKNVGPVTGVVAGYVALNFGLWKIFLLSENFRPKTIFGAKNIPPKKFPPKWGFWWKLPAK